MSDWCYNFEVKEWNYKEIPESNYTISQFEKKEFVDELSKILVKAQVGWGCLKYKLILREGWMEPQEYMVLYTKNMEPERWINIECNSKGACLKALGQDIW